jgi:tetratricopeptide (TPR) repeat protein
MKGYCHKYYEIFRDIFVGTAESYEKRLDMFEKVGDIGGCEGGVERALRRLLEGQDVEKLQALRELAGMDVLGDPKLKGFAADRIVELMGEEETEEAASALYFKGQGQNENRENDAALVSYGKALVTRIKLEGEGGDNVIVTRQAIATVYKEKDENERALEEYEVALKLSEASSHSEHGVEGKATATIIASIGNVHKVMKNYDKALELLKRSLEMKEKAGAEKADILTTVGLIASTYRMAGRDSEAAEWNEMCLAGQEAELGKNHPVTLTNVYNIGVACAKAGAIDKAVEHIERVLTGLESGAASFGAPFQERVAARLGALMRKGGGQYTARLEALEKKYPEATKKLFSEVF